MEFRLVLFRSPQPGETVAEAGFGGSPCPVGREPLSPRPDIHVLTRASALHGALVAAPGRQDTAHLDAGIGASIKAQKVGVAPRGSLLFGCRGRSSDNELTTRSPGRGMRNAGHGWPGKTAEDE